MEKIKEKIQKSENLKTHETTSKNPLVQLKNVMNCLTDMEILEAINKQNAEIVEGLSEEEKQITKVRFKRKTRNPLQSHVVLEVHPKLWNNMMASQSLFIDVQKITVEDKSPLIQCTRCLSYGHSRRVCTEQKDLCSHCGGEHTRVDCPRYAEGCKAECKNCSRARFRDLEHDAFSGDCPVRRKWDAIARSSVQYTV